MPELLYNQHMDEIFQNIWIYPEADDAIALLHLLVVLLFLFSCDLIRVHILLMLDSNQ